MVQILRSKNLATKFQILVEIAENQPNIQQKDIAKRLDVSPQAISDYIKVLTKEGSVTSDGRSRYRITREGVRGILEMARELQSYSAFVGKVVTDISVSAAIADCDLDQGQPVWLFMKDGLLFASDVLKDGARGIATCDAKRGQDVGISNIEGVMEHKAGSITVCKVSGIQRGGSRNVDLVRLREAIDTKALTGVIGIEALIALRQLGAEPNYVHSVKEVVVETAWSGLSFLVVCVDNEMPGLLKRLEEEGLDYELLDLRKGDESH